MKRFFSALLFFVWFSVDVAQGQVDEIRRHFLDAQSDVVLVAAHRAAHINYPENSIPSIKEAIRLGVDIVELDVKVSKDGIPVLMHDGTIDRTTTGTGKPSDYTYEQMKQFRLIQEGDTTEQLIPTFDEALKLIKGKVLVDIDLKTDQLDPIIEVIQQNRCEDHVFFFDNDYEALQYVKDANPEFYLMPRAYSYEMADSAITRFKPEVVHIDFKFYTPELVQLIKSNDARIWINSLGLPDLAFGTENEDKALDKILTFGANIIQTDRPELLLKGLKKRNLHP